MSEGDLATRGLDPEWIAANLEIDGARPSGAEFGGFIGTGQMSRNARIRLEWDGGVAADRPASVVVKVPSSDEGTRVGAFEHGAYAKECLFYDALLDRVDINSPHPFLVDFDQPANDFVIVLADLADSEQGDQFTEPTIEQLELAIDQAAALHAPVWGQAHDPVFASFHAGAEARIERYGMVMPLFLATALERLGPGLDDGIIPFLERYAANYAAWVPALAEPVTLVHGDFRPDNFLFGQTGSAPPIAVVDWQTLALGRGAADVAYLIAGSLTPERRHADEDALVERYVSALQRRGVPYSLDECRADYAIGALHGISIALGATTLADRTERGDALFTLMLNRHGRHAIEERSLERLGC